MPSHLYPGLQKLVICLIDEHLVKTMREMGTYYHV
jgi:hypothetical protein